MNSVALLQTVSAAVLNGAFAWLVGALCVRLWLADAYPHFLSRLDGALRRSSLLAALACLLASAGSLWAATALMGDSSLAEAAPMLLPVAFDTSYGRAGLYGMAAIAAFAALDARVGSVRKGAGIGIALLTGFALARASVSHAGEHGMLSIAYGLEVLHLLLVGVWAGGVALAASLVLPAAQAALAVPGYLRRLSQAATLALAGIVASGAFNAWQRLASPTDLADHPYGQALGAKLALFAVAALLGAYNRFAGFPLAERDGGRRALQVLRIETAIFVLVFAAAAWLTVQQPPG